LAFLADGRAHGRGRFLAEVALMGQAGDRGRERLAGLEVHGRFLAALEVIEQLEDAGPPLRGVVLVDVQVRDPPEA
jgi:hypothetical protein